MAPVSHTFLFLIVIIMTSFFASALYYCPSYSTSNTDSATQNTVNCGDIQACAGTLIYFKACNNYMDTSCNGDIYIRLRDDTSNTEVASNGDTEGSCEKCSELTYSVPYGNGCRTYTLLQGCYEAEACSARFLVTYTIPPTIAPSTSSSIPSNSPTFAPSLIPSIISTVVPSFITAVIPSNPPILTRRSLSFTPSTMSPSFVPSTKSISPITPTFAPSASPILKPFLEPTKRPFPAPNKKPTNRPTNMPRQRPSEKSPTEKQYSKSTEKPQRKPTNKPNKDDHEHGGHSSLSSQESSNKSTSSTLKYALISLGLLVLIGILAFVIARRRHRKKNEMVNPLLL